MLIARATKYNLLNIQYENKYSCEIAGKPIFFLDYNEFCKSISEEKIENVFDFCPKLRFTPDRMSFGNRLPENILCCPINRPFLNLKITRKL